MVVSYSLVQTGALWDGGVSIHLGVHLLQGTRNRVALAWFVLG